MNTPAQAVNFKMDELLASRFTNTVEDGAAILDTLRSIHYSSNQICYFDVDRFTNRKLNVVESRLTSLLKAFLKVTALQLTKP